MAVNAVRNVVPGVFTSREQAEAAINELRTLGFDTDDLCVPVTDPAHHRIIDKSQVEALKGLAIGAAIGAPLGALLGIGLLLITVPSLMATGIGGVFVAIYLGGGFGGYLGSILGLGTEIGRIVRIERRYAIPRNSLSERRRLIACRRRSCKNKANRYTRSRAVLHWTSTIVCYTHTRCSFVRLITFKVERFHKVWRGL
jgi:hypothetical protein